MIQRSEFSPAYVPGSFLELCFLLNASERFAMSKMPSAPSTPVPERLCGEQAQPLESDSPQHSQTHPAKVKKEDFRRGDRVSFTDKYLQPQVGTVTRVNQRTASVECDGGSSWRLPFSMLNHVLDI